MFLRRKVQHEVEWTDENTTVCAIVNQEELVMFVCACVCASLNCSLSLRGLLPVSHWLSLLHHHHHHYSSESL